MTQHARYFFFASLMISGSLLELGVVIDLALAYIQQQNNPGMLEVLPKAFSILVTHYRATLLTLLLLSLSLRFRWRWVGPIFFSMAGIHLGNTVGFAIEIHSIWQFDSLHYLGSISGALLLLGSIGLFLVNLHPLQEWLKEGSCIKKGLVGGPLLGTMKSLMYLLFFTVMMQAIKDLWWISHYDTEEINWLSGAIIQIGYHTQLYLILLMMIWSIYQGFLRGFLLFGLYLGDFWHQLNELTGFVLEHLFISPVYQIYRYSLIALLAILTSSYLYYLYRGLQSMQSHQSA